MGQDRRRPEGLTHSSTPYPSGAGAGTRAEKGAPGGAALCRSAEAAGSPARYGHAALGGAVASALLPLWGLGPEVGGAQGRGGAWEGGTWSARLPLG